MLKVKRFLKKFDFEFINSKNLDTYNIFFANEIEGVDLFSHLFILWKLKINFTKKVIIIDSNEILESVFASDEEKKYLTKFFNFLKESHSNILIFSSKKSDFLFVNNLLSTKTNDFILIKTLFSEQESLSTFLSYVYRKNSEITRIHASLVSIFGEGVIIMGKSGIGKSELVLNLIDKNHLFVADDALDIIEFAGELFGYSAESIKNLLEIRGIGIIDIKKAKGIETIINSTKISLVINLEHLNEVKSSVERLGSEYEYLKIHNLEIPKITIPVSEGRSLVPIVEMAVIVYKLKKYDKYNFLEEFNKNLNNKNE